MNDPVVTISHLTKRFAKDIPPALDDINAEIPKGKIVGLAGPDGAGKTTLIRLIAGLLLPSEGKITVGGCDSVADSEAIHTFVGYMPQKFGLYEELSVIQNLNLYADLSEVLGKDRERSIEELLKFTDLKSFKDRLASNLSGGMKQKLGLACALIRKPALLLLDEPSVGVDPVSRRELWSMMQGLLTEGLTVLWSTAYLDEAEKCHSVLLLNEGKLLFAGPPKDLTQEVEGRVFKITGTGSNRRRVLSHVLQYPDVIDGIIQGSDVRITLNDRNAPLANMHRFEENKLKLIPAIPRFEDAFISILGGGPGGHSVLADKTAQIETRSSHVVEADGLTKKFGAFVAADRITFQVKNGEIFGLLGPNGAGKSTTFKMLCGLLKPTQGKAFVNGLDLQIAPGEARSHIGYMAQKFSLYGNLSVKQNLDFFSGIYNLTGRNRRDAIEEMIAIFNLSGYLNASAEELPLGFKQRLALSCAVMHRPSVLFLDEPTAGVDPITRREFWSHINGLVEKGVTIMVTTHFMDEAEFCDRIALVYQSHIIEMGTPDTLKSIASTSENPYPTLEDAFISLIEQYENKNARSAKDRG